MKVHIRFLYFIVLFKAFRKAFTMAKEIHNICKKNFYEGDKVRITYEITLNIDAPENKKPLVDEPPTETKYVIL